MTTINLVSRRRWRVAGALTVAMILIYFGFIFLVAFQKNLMGWQVLEGLSLGMILGALVIVSAWVLTYIYVRWANTTHDTKVKVLKERKRLGDL